MSSPRRHRNRGTRIWVLHVTFPFISWLRTSYTIFFYYVYMKNKKRKHMALKKRSRGLWFSMVPTKLHPLTRGRCASRIAPLAGSSSCTPPTGLGWMPAKTRRKTKTTKRPPPWRHDEFTFACCTVMQWCSVCDLAVCIHLLVEDKVSSGPFGGRLKFAYIYHIYH